MPTPATLTRTASDATTITFEAKDDDGIYCVEAYYAKPGLVPHGSFGTPVAGCPKRFIVKLPRTRMIRGRRADLWRVTVFDCRHVETGKHGMTEFSIDDKGEPKRTRVTEMPYHTQKMRESMMALSEELERRERWQRFIVVLLILTFLMAFWAAIGPLFL